MKNFKQVMANALKLAERREWLGKNAIHCPQCGTEQVQLVDHIVKPAQWKCRHCKYKYEFEPDGAN